MGFKDFAASWMAGGSIEGSLLGLVVGTVLGGVGGFLFAFPGFRIPVMILAAGAMGLGAWFTWIWLGGFNGWVIGTIGGFIASLATSPMANILFSGIVSAVVAALNFGVGTLLDGGLGALLGALVQPLYYGGIRLISNLGTDVLAGLSMLIPAALGILPGFLAGLATDALSGILPGFFLGSLLDLLTGSAVGSPVGALTAAIGGSLMGGLIGMIMNPGKWIGAGLVTIPGGIAGGALGNVLGRPLGLFLLPGKWILGHVGRRLGELVGLIPGAVKGLALLPGKWIKAFLDGELLEHLLAPLENAMAPAPVPAGCTGNTCQCIAVPGAAMEERVLHDIPGFRRETMLALRSSEIPQTGDKGVESCMAVSILSAIILLLLGGARKKED